MKRDQHVVRTILTEVATVTGRALARVRHLTTLAAILARNVFARTNGNIHCKTVIDMLKIDIVLYVRVRVLSATFSVN